MKKILLSLSAFALISTTVVASENIAKGLNVMITSEDAQTQMMGMVLFSEWNNGKHCCKITAPKEKPIKASYWCIIRDNLVCHFW